MLTLGLRTLDQFGEPGADPVGQVLRGQHLFERSQLVDLHEVERDDEFFGLAKSDFIGGGSSAPAQKTDFDLDAGLGLRYGF